MLVSKLCWGILTDCEQGHQKCPRNKALQYLRSNLPALDPGEAEEEVFRVRPVAVTIAIPVLDTIIVLSMTYMLVRLLSLSMGQLMPSRGLRPSPTQRSAPHPLI